MWFKAKGTAKRPHPYEKPQEGQRLTQEVHVQLSVLCFWWQIHHKTIHFLSCLCIFDRTFNERLTTHLFFPLVLLLLITVILQNKLLPTPEIHLYSLFSLIKYTRCRPNPTPHIYNGQKHSSHVPSVHTEIDTWNQQYSHGSHSHSESSHNKTLWNGKSTMLSQSLCRCWKT